MQIAIELPDEWVNNMDVKTVAREFLEFVTAKYAAKQSFNSETSKDCLENLLRDIPFIQSLAGQDPLALQKEMRDEWH